MVVLFFIVEISGVIIGVSVFIYNIMKTFR